MERLNDRIKRLRVERKMNQEDVAKACGVSRVAVTKWESGETANLKLDNVLALAKLFCMSVGAFLQAEFDKTPESRTSASEPIATYYMPEIAKRVAQLDPSKRRFIEDVLDSLERLSAPPQTTGEVIAHQQQPGLDKISAALNKQSAKVRNKTNA